MKLCIIYNFAQHYRTSIFRLLDQAFDCDFYFGESYLDIKKMDYSLLKGKVSELKTIKFGPFIYRIGSTGLLRKQYDAYIILGETRVLSVWIFALMGRLFYPKKKIYYWTHGWYGKEKGLSKHLSILFNKLPQGGLFLYGNYAKRLLINEGFDEKKLYVVHNSLAYDEQLIIRHQLTKSSIFKDYFGNTNPTLIFVGRITAIKKLDMVLKAIEINNKIGRNYNFVLIGGGEKKNELEKYCIDNGISNQVWFYGPCYDEKIIGELIYNSDLCVSPGNVGLTAIHTMVFGTPVLTHNNLPYQMPEYEAIIDNQTGSFFEDGNIDSLANKINLWFDNFKDKRETIRLACMKEIDDNWTPYFQINIFKQVLLHD